MGLKPYVTILVVLTVGIVFPLSGDVSAEPSSEMADKLAAGVPALPDGKASLQGRILELLRRARQSHADLHLCFSIERVGKSEQHYFKPSTEGTLREHLDSISAQTNYTWLANGDWVNFIPKSKVADSNYILNQRIPGTVVVSKDSSKHTSLKDWFVARRASSARNIHSIRIKGLRPKPVEAPESITLTNPTLREYVNTNESFYGNDTWTVTIMQYPPKEGEVESRISLLWWGQNRRELVPVASHQ
ncbi:MAG: hypothetical protein HYX78_01530 [Armatimonadetes bacterium]|nr:hypothetical protein [Armatimonadota bacterium]